MKPVARHLDRAPGQVAADARVAVVLLHVGGPASDDGPDDGVEAFYRRVWSDRALSPTSLRGWVGGGVKAAWKECGDGLVAGHRLIGARSPVLDLVASQALALENRLNGRPVMAPPSGGAFRALAGFLHASPSIEDAVSAAAATGASEVIGVPMYAQRSVALTGPLVGAFESAARRAGFARAAVVPPYHDHARLLQVLTDRARRSLELVPRDLRDGAFLILAAHSPPYSRADADAFLSEVEVTAQRVMAGLGFDESRSAVAWTSFRAPARMLSPSVEEFCVDRGKAGCKALVVAPITHVTDAYETLHDLDIEAYQAATTHGVVQYRRVPTLNADPAWIDLLAALTLARVSREAADLARRPMMDRGESTSGGPSAPGGPAAGGAGAGE